MTAAQAASLVAALRSAHPTRRIPSETTRLWEQRLLPLEYNKAAASVSDIIDHSPYWPSFAEFRSHYKRHVELESRQRRNGRDEYTPVDPQSPEGQRLLREMRAYVAAIGRSL